MRTKATTLGAAIVERERELDGLFARQEIDQKGLEELGYEIARLQGELRVAHLEAHLKVKSVLTDLQIAQYVQLRGYHSGSEHHRHQ
jgi:Spy/CpxP family protein refolding chaperone